MAVEPLDGILRTWLEDAKGVMQSLVNIVVEHMIWYLLWIVVKRQNLKVYIEKFFDTDATANWLSKKMLPKFHLQILS